MFGNTVVKLLEGVTTLPAETLISSASRLAGTFMFRSESLNTGNAQPGQVVLFPNAEVKAAQLSNLITVTLQGLGCVLDMNKAKAALDTSAISSITLLETQTRLEPLFRAISKTAGLTLTESGTSAAIASAFLASKRPHGIDINRAYMTAIYGMHEGLKHVPAPLPEDAQ
jgi:hypothetical protein